VVVVYEDGRSQGVVGETAGAVGGRKKRSATVERGDADEELRAVRCQVALGLGARSRGSRAGLCHNLAERLRELRYQQSGRAVLSK
jgi:hypothetical protein